MSEAGRSLLSASYDEVEYEPPSRTNLRVIGASVHNRPLHCAYFGAGPANGNGTANTTLVVAGIHGDEMQGVSVARSLIDLLSDRPEMFAAPGGPLAGARVVVVPLVNPDGAVANRRRNARLVDLNRNFPASNWVPTLRKDRYHGGLEPASEPETLAIIRLVFQIRPNKIIAIHAITGGSECNNFDGPAEGLAELMSSHNGYPVEPSIGYATPGSLGTWAGIQKGVATLTLELRDRRSAPHSWKANREALLAALAYRCPSAS